MRVDLVELVAIFCHDRVIYASERRSSLVARERIDNVASISGPVSSGRSSYVEYVYGVIGRLLVYFRDLCIFVEREDSLAGKIGHGTCHT